MTAINFNGKTYNSLEEMPADQRAAYEQIMSFMKDENHNGIPDMLEGDAIQKMMTMASTRVIVNGQEVQNIESLPPETRAKFDQAMAKLSGLGISIPENSPQAISQPAPQIAPIEPAFPQSSAFPQDSPSVISEDTGSRTGLIIGVIAVLVILGLCALAAGGYFLLNQ